MNNEFIRNDYDHIYKYTFYKAKSSFDTLYTHYLLVLTFKGCVNFVTKNDKKRENISVYFVQFYNC